jgi:hypothetical protein
MHFIMGFAIAASVFGCGGPGGHNPDVTTQVQVDLQEVADLLRVAKKPPTKVTDLAAGQSAHTQAYNLIKTGDIVVVWGVPMPGEGDMATAPKNVLAYEKKSEQEGGYVLFLNGTIEKLSAEQFKTAPKAK